MKAGELSDSESEGEDEEEGSDDEIDTAEPKESVAREKKGNHGKAGKPTGLRGVMAALRAELGENMESVPLGDESLKQFFARTAAFWNEQVVDAWRERGEEERLTEKEVKREAFKLAETRYNELLPSLNKLREMEEQQTHMEEESSGRGNRRNFRR